ncbi:MAG: ribosomal-processing cysteine protease Prp [Moorellales bacterium]
MIRVDLYYRQGRPVGMVVRGHAGYAPRGRDIVCAAVSALAQTTVLALERLLGLRPRLRIEEGYLECFLSEEGFPPEAELLLESAALGLAEIERTHPSHLKIFRYQEGEQQRPGGE